MATEAAASSGSAVMDTDETPTSGVSLKVSPPQAAIP